MKKIVLFTVAFLFLGATYAQKNKLNLLIGTYTQGCDSKGIYVYDFDSKTGDFKLKNTSAPTVNPSFLTVSDDNKFVYAVNEFGSKSSVSAFNYDKSSAQLQLLNTQPSEGADPCHIITDGPNVMVANYSGGSITVFKKKSDGSLSAANQIISHEGKGPNAQRQEGPHVHMLHFSPDKKYVLATDLGTDTVTLYAYNPNSEKIVLTQTAVVAIKSGSGPRHLTFSPDGKYIYLLQELTAALSVFEYGNGQLKLIQETSLLSPDFKGSFSAADLHFSPDGKFLYASNRGEANTISIFKVEKNGLLKVQEHQSSLGKGPRNFVIDPSGNFLLVGHQYTNEVVVFKRNKKTGSLTATGKKISLCAPVCLVFTKK
ncbi:lactonase family protein [Flavobacterium turcicum]|uniref:Lactonase family protein n=1 Tax=Flavobacterium turcicum TaxID=2764718 RepID=A0ABR7JHN2_9FLAO|nr:lactonase family protein [Flavobacterium turcicum]MBC5864003.1 lactonase family protein [Flavobacterium turcicum]NHL02769.1 lactonase family protein [Flavobacterium turcicum]